MKYAQINLFHFFKSRLPVYQDTLATSKYWIYGNHLNCIYATIEIILFIKSNGGCRVQ